MARPKLLQNMTPEEKREHTASLRAALKELTATHREAQREFHEAQKERDAVAAWGVKSVAAAEKSAARENNKAQAAFLKARERWEKKSKAYAIGSEKLLLALNPVDKQG